MMEYRIMVKRKVTKRKKEKELMRVVAFSIKPEQEILLKAMAGDMGKNISEVLRELLPTVEEYRAFYALQEYINKKKPEDVLKIIAKAKRMFVEVLMSSHLISPIGMQCAAVSYFDKSGDEVMKLFRNFMKAVQRIDYRYKIVRVEFPVNGKRHRFNIVVSPKEDKEAVKNLIGRYSVAEETSLVEQRIKTSFKLKMKKTKSVKSNKLKTKKK